MWGGVYVVDIIEKTGMNDERSLLTLVDDCRDGHQHSMIILLGGFLHITPPRPQYDGMRYRWH